MAFGAFAPIGAWHAASVGGWVPTVVPPWLTGAAASVVGVAAVGTSVMVYAATGRAGWRPARVATRFVLTATGLGGLATAAVATVGGATTAARAGHVAAVATAVSLAALVVDILPLRPADGDPAAPATRTARLLRGPLRGHVQVRVGLGLLAGALGTAATLVLTGAAERGPAVVTVVGALVAAVGAELVARSWFFTRRGVAADAGGTGMTLADRLRRTDGPLTRQLVRTPGRFGLGQVPADRAPDRVARMICGYCSTGCSLDVHLQDGLAVNVTPTTAYPVNLGMACPKGWEALAPMEAPDRLGTPLLRGADGRLRPVDWTTAATTFADRMQAVQREHGPDSVAFLSTGQIPSEEMALLGAVAKFGMGFRHGDGNTRQCMATAVVAYKQAFGFDAPPYTYADFEESDVVVLVGSNLAVAHPIMWERLARNLHDPAIVVVDPRRTETAMAATQHVPVRPKADLELFYGLGHLLLELDAVDHAFVRDHTSGFDAYAAHVAAYPPAVVNDATGIPVEELSAAGPHDRRGTSACRSGGRWA